MNELKLKFDLKSRECKILCEEFGDANVETALIFIAQQCDPRGLRVAIQPTYEMVRDILEAAHGRLGVGWVRMKSEKTFYHHPDRLIDYRDPTDKPIGESTKS